MIKSFQNINFIFEPQLCLRGKVFFPHKLDCTLLSCYFMFAQFDFSKPSYVSFVNYSFIFIYKYLVQAA